MNTFTFRPFDGGGSVEPDRPEGGIEIARAGVRRIAGAAEMGHDAPDRVQRRLHRALDPGRGPADAVAGKENAALRRRQGLLHEMAIHAMVVAVMPRQRALEGTEEILVGLPAHADRIAADMAGDIHPRIDPPKRRERQLHPLFRVMRQHLQRIGHPRIGQADHPGPVRPVVEEIGAAGDPVGQRHRHHRPPGRRVDVVPERPVDHHEGLCRLHVAGAIERHPELLVEKLLVGLDRGGQQVALAGHQHRVVKIHTAPAIGHRDGAAGIPRDPRHARARRAAVQPGQRHLPPMRAIGGLPPEPVQHVLHPADDIALVVVKRAEVHPQDLEHRIREVAVPAAGAEPDLPEHLAVAEAELAEGLGGGDEIIEGALVPGRDERVPDLLHARGIPRRHRRAQVGKPRPLLKRRVIGARDLAIELGQIVERAGEKRLALKIDHRRAGRLGQRVRKGRALAAEKIDVMVETARRDGKAHAAEFGDDILRALEGLRAQPPAEGARFIKHRAQAELHQLVPRDHPRRARTDDRDRGAVARRGNLPEPGRIGEPVVIGKGKVGPESREF
ncbi:hypothetical protein SDC9_35816 [bioreactor metagenome]|uniref:Uncharacterized protein n=1 Tax=bioreactor metagenome TaxID=1076179 RepID=A0A644VEE2_9ZZZZ